MHCEECGCRQVVQHSVEGFRVAECDLCGHLEGDADALASIERIREARRLGIDPMVYPVVKTLGHLPGLRVVASGQGQRERGIVPFIQFVLESPDALQFLERIVAEVGLFNRGSSRCYWIIEVEYQRYMTFDLKASFRKGTPDFGPAEVLEARDDLQDLALRLESIVLAVR